VAVERHASHQYLEWLEYNKEQLLSGYIAPLAIGGQTVEIDTTTPDSFNYTDLLEQVRATLQNTLTS
jgi:hypothetical protein